MKNKLYKINISFFLLFSLKCLAQIGIGTRTPNRDAMLEIVSSDKGFLLPRVSLTSTSLPSPLSSHVVGMCVYNIAITGDVTQGYYYNDGDKWIKLTAGSVGPQGPPGVPGTTMSAIAPINVDSGIISINNFGVTTVKLAANAVTEDKIANNAVSVSKLPAGASNTTFLRGDGVWSDTSVNITSTEAALPYKIDGKQLYAIKGSFVANGSSVTVTVVKPPGITGYYSFTSYKDGRTFRRDIISFDTTATSNNVVTGSGFIAEAYPAGEYNYILEYFK